MASDLTADLLRHMIELDKRGTSNEDDYRAADEFLELLFGTKEHPGYWPKIAALALDRLESGRPRYRKQILKKRERRIMVMVFGATCTTPHELARFAAADGGNRSAAYRCELRATTRLISAGLLEKSGERLSVTDRGHRLLENTLGRALEQPSKDSSGGGRS